MAQPIGVAGVRTVNKKPQHKTVPIRRVIRDSGVANNAPARRKPSPPPSWTRPLHTSLTPRPQPKRVRIPSPVTDPQFHFPSAQTLIARGNRHDRNVQARSAHKAARQDVLHSLGLGPARTIRSVGFAPSPPMLIGDQRRGALLRDSGVANNPSPTYHGQALSPQAISHAMATVLRDGHSLQAQGAIGLLHAAGVSDPFGSTTRHEQQAAARAQHEAVVKEFVKHYKDLSKLNYGLLNKTLSEAEVRRRIAGASTAQLIHAMQTYRPSALQMGARRVQTEGLSGNPLHILASIPDAFGTGLGVIQSGVHAVAGNGLLGNALSDAAFLPIGAMGAIATGVAHPLETVKGLAGGAIGHAVGDIAHGRNFNDVLKVAHDHPLFTAFELQAAKALAGRGLGAGLRAVPGREFAALARDPVALIDENGTRAIYERGYSKDLFNQLGQRALDKRLKPGPQVELRGKMVPSRLMQTNRGGRVGNAVANRALGQVHGHLVNRFVDVFVSRVNALNRHQREVNARYARAHAPVRQHGGKDVRNLQARIHAGVIARRELALTALRLPADQRPSALAALHVIDQHLQGLADTLDGLTRSRAGRVRQRLGEAVDRSLPSQPLTRTGERVAARFPNLYRSERDVVSHAVQGVIRSNPEIRSVQTLREDLVAEQTRLKHAAADPQNPRREMALQQVAAIQRVLENPKALANAEGVFRSQAHLAARLNEQERNNVRLGLASGAADRTKLFPFAQAHMGAQYGQSSVDTAARFNQIAATEQALAKAKAEEQAAAGTRGRLEHAVATRQALERDLARLKQAKQPEALRNADGTPLSNADIHAAMRAHGVNPADVAYLQHIENPMGPSHDRGAYYKRFKEASRENIQGAQKRTGELFRQGATAYDYNALIDQMVRHGTKAVNAQQLDKLVHDIGIKNPDGTYLTAAEFHRLQLRMRAAGTPVEAIVGHQQRLSADIRKGIQEGQNPIVATHRGGMLGEMTDAMTKAGATSARRNIIAVPSAFMDRLRAHNNVNGDPLGGRAFSSAFRKTVLPFSTKWMVGNVAEGVLRAVGTAGAIPIWDNRIARKALANIFLEDAKASGGAEGIAAVRRYAQAVNRADRRAAMRDVQRHAPNAQAAKAELLGMLFYGNKGLTAKARVGSGNLASHPAVHALGKTVDTLTAPSFALNRRLEQGLQEMVLGKHMRQQIHEFQHSWIKSITAQKQALADASKGLLDTSGQVRAAKMMDDVLGRYSRFSPKTRAWIQTAAPFLPWYINAARFTFVTLPLHNPIKTAVLTSVERQFQADWQQQHKDIKNPGELNTAIKLRNGSYLDLARFTPFSFPGAVAAGDYGQIVSPLLPQIQGIEHAFNNQDPFGQPLQTRGADGKMRPLTKGEQLAYIANTIGEETVPLAALIRRIMEGGATALPTSTMFGIHTKPGSNHGPSGILGGLNRALNPFRPVFLRNARSSSGQGKALSPVDQAVQAISGGASSSAIDQALKAIGGG